MKVDKGAPRMEHGVLRGGMPERWITQIDSGVVTLVQRIEADAFVVRAQDLPMLAANEEIVSDQLARDILRAIGRRGRVQCGEGEVDWPLVKNG